MAWFGKSSKAQGKNDMESLGIRFEPIVFYPDRNEYELCIELPGCPNELVKATYEMGKLKVEGQKYKTEFVQEFSIPADCLADKIYGVFRGEVLHIIMPRLLSEWPRSEDASSKQEEDDPKASSDRKATTEAGENHGQLPATVPKPPPPDQKMTNEVKDLGREIQQRNSLNDLNAFSDREKLTSRVPTPLPSDQKSTENVNERGGKEHDKLPARVPAPSPSPSPSDPKSKEKLRRRDNELFLEISATPLPAPEPSRFVKELEENYQRNLSKTAAPPPPPPSSPPHAAATTSWNRKATKIRARQEKEEDQKLPSTVVPTSPSSDQKKSEQKDVESDKPVVKSQKNDKKSKLENAKNARFVTKSKDKEESKEKKHSDGGGNEMLGLVAKVKETGKAAVTAAMKEENRLVLMIGAAVLTIVVIGASWRRKRNRN